MKQGRRAVLAACGLLIGAGMTQSCKDDALTGQPEWLGNSIYERLQEDGNYTTVLRLIDDLGQTEVLRHTGSKTLFAADDQAYQDWYRSNSWGVHSYDQLSQAQKKLLLNNSMINNAYLIELMSNAKSEGDATAPEEGRTMRRETALSLYDSVYIMPPSAMPNTASWADLKSRGKSIPIFKDASTAPMIHFLPAYMYYNKITNEDLAILSNHESNNIADAWVNGKKVIERDITCKNGYIQKVSGVIESSPNMAEVIHQHPDMSKWGEMIDLFSAPYYYPRGTAEYDRIYDTEDSVYVLRYFSKRSYDPTAAANSAVGENSKYPNGDPVLESLLSFDPGWNQYYGTDGTTDLHKDAGAMIVPTNAALEEWWNNGGRELKNEYGVIDSLPSNTLATLINVHMLGSFAETVPSKFVNVLNDAKEQLGITPEDVDSCFMACNGVVYMVNKVFQPAEFQSVLFPATAHKNTMSIIYWTLTGAENDRDFTAFNFQPYLLSMDSKYAVLLPTNNAMLQYIDPFSYGSIVSYKDQAGLDSAEVEGPDVLRFYYDITKKRSNRVQATRYKSCEVDDYGNIALGDPVSGTVSASIINSLLEPMVDYLIIVIPDPNKVMTLEDYIDQGYQYFKTKGGGLLRVTRAADGNLAFEGGWQIEHNHRQITATQAYTKVNGVSYEIEDQVPMPSQKSFYLTLKEHDEYEGFLELLENDYCDLLASTIGKTTVYTAGLQSLANKNMKLFDNYNYTAYVPSTAAIRKLQQEKILPTIEELEFGDADEDADLLQRYPKAELCEYLTLDSICHMEGWYGSRVSNQELKEQLMSGHITVDQYNEEMEARKNIRNKAITAIKGLINDFIRYHVQDHSIALGMAMNPNAYPYYESMKRNTSTGRFAPLMVVSSPTEMTVTDEMGTPHKINTTPGLFNNLCREYWFTKDGRLFMNSDVVVHLIDQALIYEEMTDHSGNLLPWRKVVSTALGM